MLRMQEHSENGPGHCCHEPAPRQAETDAGAATGEHACCGKDPVAHPPAPSGHCCDTASAERATIVPAVQYGCPMHPEVVQQGPGECPICGMALEPLLPAGAGPWVCPMCPGVSSPVPASCPKCGMALERALPVAASEESDELRDMRRRFRVSLFFTVPLVLIAMAGMSSPVSQRIGEL